MKTYEIKRKCEGWEDIPRLYITEKYFETPDSTSAWAQIAYDEEGIWVHMRTDEAEHRNVETGPVGEPCADSCLEFFFSPSPEEKRYMNFEINSNLCMYLGFASNIKNLVRILPEEKDIFSAAAKRDGNGWEVEYKIPLSYVRRFFPDFEIYEGKRISANVFKCAEAMSPRHFLSWSRVNTEGFTFHQREHFGEMIFIK